MKCPPVCRFIVSFSILVQSFGIEVNALLLSLFQDLAPIKVLALLDPPVRFLVTISLATLFPVWLTCASAAEGVDERLMDPTVAPDGWTRAPAFRTATVRNLDSRYAAFQVERRRKLYLPPEQRVVVW